MAELDEARAPVMPSEASPATIARTGTPLDARRRTEARTNAATPRTTPSAPNGTVMIDRLMNAPIARDATTRLTMPSDAAAVARRVTGTVPPTKNGRLPCAGWVGSRRTARHARNWAAKTHPMATISSDHRISIGGSAFRQNASAPMRTYADAHTAASPNMRVAPFDLAARISRGTN